MSLGHCAYATALGALGHTRPLARPLCKAGQTHTGLQRHCDNNIVQLLYKTSADLRQDAHGI